MKTLIFFSGNFMVYPFLFRLIIHQLILYYENYLIFTSSNIFGYAIYSHHNANLLPPKLTYEAVRNGCSPKRTSVTIQTDQLDLSPSEPFATTLAKWKRHRLEALSIQNMENYQLSANFPMNVLVSFLWPGQNTWDTHLKEKRFFFYSQFVRGQRTLW